MQGKVSHWEQQDYQGLPATGTVAGNFTIRPETFIGPKDIDPSHAEFQGVWGTLEHTLNDIWSLTFKARYTQSEFDQKVQSIFGSDALQADQPLFNSSTWIVVNSELFQEQEEISLVGNVVATFNVGPTDNTVLLGADYSQIDDQGFLEFDLNSLTSVDLNSPVFSSPYRLPASRINNLFVKNTTYGGYVQLQSTLYERLHFLAGVRLGNVTIDYNNTIPGFSFTAQSDTTKFLPRFGTVFDLTNEVSLFAGYSKGMRGQPFHNFTTVPKPELSRHIEAGVKFDIAKQLTGQIAVYRIDLDNVLVTDSTKIPRLSHFAKQRSQGFEADLIWQPNDKLSFLANYAYTKAEFANGQAGIAKGTPLPGIPEHSGRFWANYRFQQTLLKGLTIGAGIYAQSGVYLSNSHLFKTNSYYTIDASVSYEIDHFKLGVSVKNLTDQSYFERLDYYGSHVAPGEGLSLFSSISMRY